MRVSEQQCSRRGEDRLAHPFAPRPTSPQARGLFARSEIPERAIRARERAADHLAKRKQRFSKRCAGAPGVKRMFRLSAAVPPHGLTAQLGSKRRHLALLAAGSSLALVLLAAAGIVPLPSLIDRWWQAIVPGSPSPASRLSLPAYPGPFTAGLGPSRTDAALQRFGSLDAPTSVVGPKPALGATHRPHAKRQTSPAPSVEPASPTATTPVSTVTVATRSIPTPTTTTVVSPPVSTPLPTTPAVTTPSATVPGETTPVATTPSVTVPPVTLPGLP